MTPKSISSSLQQLISNLKLSKPSSTFQQFKKHPLYQSQPLTTQPIIYPLTQQSQQTSENQFQHNSLQDSVINDNYDELNCYSFYELKEINGKGQSKECQEFSFCQYVGGNSQLEKNKEEDVRRFSSIVDKLKTEGDFVEGYQGQEQNNCFFLKQTHDNFVNTDRLKMSDEFYCSQVHKSKQTQRRHTEYFSDSALKSSRKSYKSMSKKPAIEQSCSKRKQDPIYAKLTLHNDKQNNPRKLNQQHPNVISVLSTNKSSYSSALKKPSQPIKPQYQPIQSSTDRQRIKFLNQKIRTQNHIIYQSQVKQNNNANKGISPLSSFKKTGVQPHKFSNYNRVRLFG